MSPATILLVDDEVAFLTSMQRLLRVQGFTDVTTLSDPTRLSAILAERQFDLALLDIRMPGAGGLEVLQLIKEANPATECIMVTADDQTPTVVQALRSGAQDYLVKPVSPERLQHTLELALEHNRLVHSLHLRNEGGRRDRLKNPKAFADTVGRSEALLRLLAEAELHAQTDIPMLVTGETGVGKELLARAIHRTSPRARRPFLAVNMLALSPALFESEFFGHAAGAFTGAVRQHEGYLARADGGTLFLDEIGDLPLEMQGKLLRILQEPEYFPVGKSRPVKANVRFVAATNQPLARQVKRGSFRKDLFYRLQFAHLHLPPLRERLGDVSLIAGHVLAALDPELHLTLDALERLERYDFPGNVRELVGMLQGAANLSRGEAIEAGHLRLQHEPAQRTKCSADIGELESLAAVEKRHVLDIYEKSGRNKSQAARILGIGVKTIRRKLDGYGES